jgi:hypothetical protein
MNVAIATQCILGIFVQVRTIPYHVRTSKVKGFFLYIYIYVIDVTLNY